MIRSIILRSTTKPLASFAVRPAHRTQVRFRGLWGPRPTNYEPGSRWWLVLWQGASEEFAVASDKPSNEERQRPGGKKPSETARNYRVGDPACALSAGRLMAVRPYFVGTCIFASSCMFASSFTFARTGY